MFKKNSIFILVIINNNTFNIIKTPKNYNNII